MIKLNLLPPQLKKQQKTRNIYRMFRDNLFILFIVLTLSTISLLIGRIMIQNTFVKTVEETNLVQNRITSTVVHDVVKINTNLKEIKQIQKDFIPWPRLLIVLSKILPKEVTISQVHVTKDSNVLKLVGNAKTRTSFIEFKNNLESHELFVRVTSPITNLLKQTDLPFTLNIMLQIENLE